MLNTVFFSDGTGRVRRAAESGSWWDGIKQKILDNKKGKKGSKYGGGSQSGWGTSDKYGDMIICTINMLKLKMGAAMGEETFQKALDDNMIVLKGAFEHWTDPSRNSDEEETEGAAKEGIPSDRYYMFTARFLSLFCLLYYLEVLTEGLLCLYTSRI